MNTYETITFVVILLLIALMFWAIWTIDRQEGRAMTRLYIRSIPYYLLLLCILIATPLIVNAIEPPHTAPYVDRDEPKAICIEWDKPAEVEPIQEPQVAYALTADERTTIARIVAGEARGEEPTGRAAVADVIYNRLMDGRWGSAVDDVCTPGQFHGVRYDGLIPQDCYDAVDLVFRDGNTGWACGGLYFCTGDPAAIKAGLRETVAIGGHHFYTDKDLDS